MDIKSYFENTEGVGVLATADAEGRVDAAIYSRPHIMDSDTVAFIMRDRLTHHNLQSNPNAAYLFMESGGKFIGKRLFLTKIREEQNTELAYKLRRRKYPENKQEPLFLAFFRINKILPLIGPGEDD
jgi:hypothetical protein